MWGVQIYIYQAPGRRPKNVTVKILVYCDLAPKSANVDQKFWPRLSLINLLKFENIKYKQRVKCVIAISWTSVYLFSVCGQKK